MAGFVGISGQLTGLPQGSLTIGPITITPTASNLVEELTPTLASGANTITVPSWAQGCIIVPYETNAVALTLKGVTGDTGVPMDLTAPQLLTFPASPPASFVITAASTTAGPSTITFF